MHAAGAVAACRYLCRVDPTTAGKQLTRAEADRLRAGGIDVVSNWEQHGSWEEYSGGQAVGRTHAYEAAQMHADCGGPAGRPIFFSTDWNATSTQLPAVAEYYRGVASVIGLARTGAYGGYPTIRYLLDQGVITWAWQTYAWSSFRDDPTGQIYLHWDPRAQLRQIRNGVLVGGGDCDIDESVAADFGQWGGHPSMTTAPDDLKAIQSYCHDKTGQPWDALGIIHSTPQGGGYHEGEDLLIAAGRAPGPQYPYSDYSYADARDRDLYPSGRLAGGNYASAFDLGGGFPRRLEFNAWMLDRLQVGDPRTRDIREMIYTPDGTVVRRFDRTGKQPNSGDSTHLYHTHFSFFRDSVGRRAQSDNFLGLLVEFFEGAGTAMATFDQRDGTFGTGYENLFSVYKLLIDRDKMVVRPGVVYWNGATEVPLGRDIAALLEIRDGVRGVLAALAAAEVRDATALAAIKVLSDALAGGGGSPDAAAIVSATVTAIHEAEDRVSAKWSAQAARLAAALDGPTQTT
jgi:hypothetical protein